LGIFAIVFAESGLLVGFFLPGDSLLLSAGLLASRGFFDIKVLLGLISLGAVLGDSVGYWFGKKTGPKIFKREDSLFFHKDNILRAKAFYERHGGKTIVLARFFPMIRTFAPIVAGVGEMEYRRFLFYNLFGGIGWTLLLTLSGYFLGSVIPDIDRYFLLVLAAVISVSALPTLWHLGSNQRKN
jgi:membrane-associated protein